MIENSVFSVLGRGNWESCARQHHLDALQWCKRSVGSIQKTNLKLSYQILAEQLSGKSTKTASSDPVLNSHVLECRSSSDLQSITDESYDLVITDPPFGGLLHYAELADFFYVWLRLVLKDKYPDVFSAEYTPKALEAVANRARHPDDPDAFYQKILTECWREAKRILKPGGILAFHLPPQRRRAVGGCAGKPF